MSDQAQCTTYNPTRFQRLLDTLRRKRHAVGFWLYLHTYCRFLYRPHMRLLHRYGWHWWVHLHPIGGPRMDWCQWCGEKRTYAAGADSSCSV